MSTPTLSPTDAKKLKQIIDEGVNIKQQVKDLNAGLRDAVKTLSEELGIPAKIINKAIRTESKDQLEVDKETVSDVEEVLALAGRA